MKATKKRSPIPFYGAAALWLLWCLTLPLYRLWHFLLLAALTGGLFLLLQKRFPGTVVYEAQPEPEPDTGNAALDEALRQGREELRELRRLQAAIGAPGLNADLSLVVQRAERIYDHVAGHPEQLSQTRRFMNYYLPTTRKLLQSYTELAAQGVRGENITQAMEKIEALVHQVALAFGKELDSLFASQTMDISADIQVMEAMLAAEGLTGPTMDEA